MTTPITKQPKKAKAATPARREWCCGTPITGPHVAGCAYAPVNPEADVTAAAEPPVSDPSVGSAPAASAVPEPEPYSVAPAAEPGPPRPYGFPKALEYDLDLPSGGRVRYRKIRDGNELELELVELMDGFTPELVAQTQSDDPAEAARALAKQDTREKILGPVDRIVVAAVICPVVVIDGPTTDSQINVKDIDLIDRVTIFNAAFGEQLGRIKSLLSEPQAPVRNLSAGEDVRAEAE